MPGWVEPRTERWRLLHACRVRRSILQNVWQRVRFSGAQELISRNDHASN